MDTTRQPNRRPTPEDDPIFGGRFGYPPTPPPCVCNTPPGARQLRCMVHSIACSTQPNKEHVHEDG